MNIQPIVFNVPSTQSAPIAKPVSKVNWLPWAAVVGLLVALLWSQYRSSDVGPTPVPVVINEATAELTKDATREYSLAIASVFDDLAAKVDAKSIVNIEQLQSNSRAMTVAAREGAYVEVNKLDNEVVNGSYVGKESTVSAHLRSKAEGYRRAAK